MSNKMIYSSPYIQVAAENYIKFSHFTFIYSTTPNIYYVPDTISATEGKGMIKIDAGLVAIGLTFNKL